MRRLIPLSIFLLVSGVAFGQATDDERRAARMARWERIYAIEKRIAQVRAQRRDVPIRAQNILDEEVREIQSSAAQALPKTLVNISAVVVGCPCEDGSSCTDQIWILAHKPETTMGLLLSKIGGHWVIGPVQRWFLDYDALLERKHTYEEEDSMKERFPACAVQHDSKTQR